MAEGTRVLTQQERIKSLRSRLRYYKRQQRTATFAEAKYWINQWRRLASEAITMIGKIEEDNDPSNSQDSTR